MGANQVQPQVRMGLGAVLRRLGDRHVNDDCAYALGQAYFLDAEMTQDEIIQMAFDAGFDFSGEELMWGDVICTNELTAFAKLVAAKEQKKWEDQTAVEIYEALLEEREACAKMVEDYMKETAIMEARGCLASVAYDIRARGEQA